MITKTDLIHQIYEKSNKKLTMKEVDLLVNTLFNSMTEALNKGEKIYISDFGTFSLTKDITKTLVKVKKQINKKS